MNIPKAKLSDILGHTKKCLFKERFRFDPCRSCDGLNKVCGNYLADNNQSVDFYHLKVSTPSRQNSFQVSTADTYSQGENISNSKFYSHPLDNNSQEQTVSNQVINDERAGNVCSCSTQLPALDIIQRNETQIAENARVLRPFYWYHSTITNTLRPKVCQDLIRRANDGGCL